MTDILQYTIQTGNINTHLCNNTLLAMLRGCVAKSTELSVMKFLKSTNKTIQFLALLHHNLFSLFLKHLWKDRCNKYKTWMSSKPCTYKTFCRTHRSHLSPQRTANLLDYKHRYFISSHDKKEWTSELTTNTISSSITKGCKHIWTYIKAKVKSAAKIQTPLPQSM